MLGVAVTGISGRMGKAVLNGLLAGTDGSGRLAAAVHRPGSDIIGTSVADFIGTQGVATDVLISDSLDDASFDVLIDFTLPEPSLQHIRSAAKQGKPVVVGTTGFDRQQMAEIHSLAESTAIVLAPNMSVGVNLCFHLLHQAAAALGDAADIEIIETHHRNKLDSPSGTALRMGEVVAAALGRDLQDCAEYGRAGLGEVRDRATIGFSAVRAGDVIGDHTVLFACAGERVEITHKASDRTIYAAGAIRAAQWVAKRSAGIFDMQHVLGLK